MSGQSLSVGLQGLSPPGFFGKLPSRGDFVSRRLPADFVGAWDGWLQGALAASREALGEHWLDVYLTSPIWRFALAPGVCGEDGWLGVLMPSVDRVGRYFPLAVAAACGRARFAPALAAEHAAWYEKVERLLLATLEETPLPLDAFDEQVSRLGLSSWDEAAMATPRADTGDDGGVVGWHRRVPAGARLEDSVLRASADVLGRQAGGCGVWWTHGSERVEPCVVITSGLPHAPAAVAMLDGRWEERGWASTTLEPRAAAVPPSQAAPRFLLRSAAVTDPGKVREANEDSFVCRDDLGLWVAADGLGGHQAGDIASAMVTSVADELGLGECQDLDVRLNRFERAMRVVNACLCVLAEKDPRVALAGSTVMALLANGAGSAACAWAGDTRAYRLRDERLEQLSRDHSEAHALVPDSHVITRAVGGSDELELEVQYLELRAGDRYLLCTDGLYAEVSDEVMAMALALPDPVEACRRLREAGLAGNAPDNLTAVVVHVGAQTNDAGIGHD